MKDYIKPIETKVFRCDCRDRDHFIEASHDVYDWNISPGEENCFEEEITLSFKVTNGDWMGEHRTAENKWDELINWKDRMVWRVKCAWKVLIKGQIEIDDSWTPVRNEYKDKSFNGEKELQDLIDWLQEAVNQVRKNMKKV
jgi:hypothetical protein